jgi:hypothetical protein
MMVLQPYLTTPQPLSKLMKGKLSKRSDILKIRTKCRKKLQWLGRLSELVSVSFEVREQLRISREDDKRGERYR